MCSLFDQDPRESYVPEHTKAPPTTSLVVVPDEAMTKDFVVCGNFTLREHDQDVTVDWGSDGGFVSVEWGPLRQQTIEFLLRLRGVGVPSRLQGPI